MSVLNIPIQINGGEIDKQQLKPRELYINTKTNKLYYGKDNGVATPVRCVYTDNATNATGLGGSDKLVWINSEDLSKGAKIGNIIFYENRCEPKNNAVVTLKDFNLSNLQSLTLSSNVYGKDLPSNPVNGQVFFKI